MRLYNFFYMALCLGVHAHVLDRVVEQNLAGLAYVEEEYPDDEPNYTFLKRILGYQLLPNARKKRALFFEFLKKQEYKQSAVITSQELCDLQILKGTRIGDSFLGSHLDRTKTEIGRVTLYALLGQPIADRKQLEERQQAVRFLVEHPAVYKEISDILELLAVSENGFMSFWGQDGFVRASKRLYPKILPGLDKSPEGLDVFTTLRSAESIFVWAVKLFGSYSLGMYVLYQLGLIPEDTVDKEKVAKYQGSQGFTSIASSFVFGDPIYSQNNSYKDSFLSGYHTLFNGVLAYYFIAETAESMAWFREQRFTVLCLQRKLVHFACTIKNLRKLHEILERYPELYAIIPLNHELKTFATLELGGEISELCKLLEDEGFEKERKGLPLLCGTILRTYALVNAYKNSVKDAYLCVGHLDTFCSTAHLLAYQEGYCFAEFVERAQPYLELQDFWNPFIDHAQAVKNTVILGNEKPRNILLTGPNAGGKSTILKAIGLNLIAAQSLGIGIARRMVLTQFCKIMTSLNIVDDIVEGKSLFKAEILRMKSIVETINQLSPDEFSFTLIDELFSGTSPDEGSIAAYKLAAQLGNNTQSMCFISTHFKQLTDLEAACGTFANYRVTARIGEDGFIFYPFKIERGAADQSIGLLLAEQHGLI